MENELKISDKIKSITAIVSGIGIGLAISYSANKLAFDYPMEKLETELKIETMRADIAEELLRQCKQINEL